MAGLPWGEVSKWVALLTLTLVGVMEYRGTRRTGAHETVSAL